MLEKNLSNSVSSFSGIDLPNELFAHIASFLDLKSLLSLQVVNVFFEKLTQKLVIKEIRSFKVQITCGFRSSYLVSANGKVYAWGNNVRGQLGFDSNQVSIYQPQLIPEITVLTLATGYNHALALTSEGKVYTWGENDCGQLGLNSCGECGPDGLGFGHNDEVDFDYTPTPKTVSGLRNIGYISAKGDSCFAVRDNGIIYAWGRNAKELLGVGHIHSTCKPEVVQDLKQATQIVIGDEHTLALTKEGEVYAWGANYKGQLGVGNNTRASTPQLVSGLVDVVNISAKDETSFAVTKEGAVYTWGVIRGDLGLEQKEYNMPQLVPGLTNIIHIVAAAHHVLALTKDGKLFSWGKNDKGQLGLGNTEDSDRPQLVPGLKNIIQVCAGFKHSLALTKEGSLYAWGHGKHGQLGLGNNQNSLTPQLIPTFNLNEKITESIEMRRLTKICLENLNNKTFASPDTKQSLLKALDGYLGKRILNYFPSPKQRKFTQLLKHFISLNSNLLSITEEIKKYKELNKNTGEDKQFDYCLTKMQQIIETSKEHLLREHLTQLLK